MSVSQAQSFSENVSQSSLTPDLSEAATAF